MDKDGKFLGAARSTPSPTWAPTSRPSRPACRPISTRRCWRASIRRRRSTPRCKAVFTNTVAGRRLSRRRTAGGDLPARAHGRQGGPRDEDGPGRDPPEELHPDAMPSRTRRRSRCSTTAATTRRRSTIAAEDRRLRRLRRRAAPRPSSAASCAASASRPTSRPAASRPRRWSARSARGAGLYESRTASASTPPAPSRS